MRRGTTPTITIQTDIDLTEYSVWVTFEQGTVQKDFIPTKSADGKELEVTLTQEDTLAFSKGDVKIQIRAVDEGGTAIASNIMTAKVNELLKEGVITYASN